MDFQPQHANALVTIRGWPSINVSAGPGVPRVHRLPAKVGHVVATPSDFRVGPERTALTLPLTQNDSTTEGEPSGSGEAQQRSDKAGIDLQTFFALEENEQSAIKLAVTNGRVTTAELADERGLTLKVARNDLRQLTEGRLLEWEGKSGRDPRQYYRIANVD